MGPSVVAGLTTVDSLIGRAAHSPAPLLVGCRVLPRAEAAGPLVGVAVSRYGWLLGGWGPRAGTSLLVGG